MDRAFRIASPCSADWNRMQGDDRTRYCPGCRLNVYNFSAMTGPEIEKLLADRDGRLCARFYRRSDGTILTQDCPVGFRAVVRRVSKIAGAALSAAISVFATAQTAPKPQPSLVQISQKTVLAIEVVDPSGAVVPRASITLKDSSDAERVGLTDQSGKWSIRDLPAGTYSLSVHSPGFHTATQTVRLTDNRRTELKVALDLGVMGEVIVVDVPTTLMGSLSSIVQDGQMVELPLASSRDPVRLDPQVSVLKVRKGKSPAKPNSR